MLVETVQRQPENVAFFYVAVTASRGHQIVLASDFGRSADQPWQQAFDVDDTRRGLTANKAQTQVFLVDACREITTSNVEVPNAPAPALRSQRCDSQTTASINSTIMATSRTARPTERLSSRRTSLRPSSRV